MYQLTTSDAAGAYLANGWLLWPRDGTLLAQRLDLERHALTGEPVTVANPVVFDGITNAMAVTTSATGLMAYRSGLLARRQLAWFDRLGREFGTLGSPDDKSLSSPSVSPDGRAAAVHRAIERNADIWIVDEARSTRFTYDQAADRYPVWTRDGSAIVFDSNRTGTRDLYRKDVNGSKAEERLVESSQDKLANDISRDGRFLLYQSIDSHGGRDLWVLPLGGGAPWVFLKTAAAERFGQFSPDGRWVAYMSNESGHDEIFLRRFVPPSASHATSQSERQWQITTTGGAYPRWRSDGKELFYTGPAAQMMAVSVSLSETSVEYGAPVTLFRTRIFGGGIDTGLGIQYDVSRDGRFLINTVLEDAVKPITLVQNWRPEVR